MYDHTMLSCAAKGPLPKLATDFARPLGRALPLHNRPAQYAR